MKKEYVLVSKKPWIFLKSGFFLEKYGRFFNKRFAFQQSSQIINKKRFCFFKKKLLFAGGLLGFFFLPSYSYASTEGFPTKEIFVQVFNFSVFVLAFVFLIRKPLKLFFHKRQEEFFAFEKQAVQLEKEKQEEYQAWEKKLQILKEQETGIQKKAQTEGEKFISQKQEEIKSLKARLRKESDFFIRLEKEKSKRNLLKQWKNKVVQEAGLELEKQAQSASFQQERIKDFFKQMELHL